jgi:NTE family protein
MNYDTLCLSGAGTSGFSFISCINFLEEKNILNIKNIKRFVGTSIGSIISFFLLLGYTTNDLKKFCFNFNFNKFEQEINSEKFLLNYGLNDGSNILIFIQTFLKNKINKHDITFKELHELINKDIFIITTNYSKCQEEVFNHIKTPNMSVIKAIRKSISLPFFFTPVYYNNDIYIDGGFTNNLGVNYCNPSTTLIISSHGTFNENPKNIFDYINGLFVIIQKLINEKDLNEKFNENIINVTGIKFTFSPTSEDLTNLWNNGIKITKNFIDNNYKIFCKEIIKDIVEEAINTNKD